MSIYLDLLIISFEKRHDILTTRNTAPNFIAITMPVVNIGKVDNKDSSWF